MNESYVMTLMSKLQRHSTTSFNHAIQIDVMLADWTTNVIQAALGTHKSTPQNNVGNSKSVSLSSTTTTTTTTTAITMNSAVTSSNFGITTTTTAPTGVGFQLFPNLLSMKLQSNNSSNSKLFYIVTSNNQQLTQQAAMNQLTQQQQLKITSGFPHSLSAAAKLNTLGEEDDLDPDKSRSPSPQRSSFVGPIVNLFIYPPTPGPGRITVTNEDFFCLNDGEFLNDVIIDFYLKYFLLEKLSPDQREGVHLFSSFFYRRLTQKHAGESNSSMTPEQLRHSRVKTWTRHVDLFKKDFIIVPINESAHWYLAIICFPGLLEPIIEQISIDRGDDCANNSSSGAGGIRTSKIRFKQPCILIFDSLAVPCRYAVVRALREYIQEEWNAKKRKTDGDRTINKDNFVGAFPRCPLQTNYSDCGLYVLQYVESFFQNPIIDYVLPITSTINWFKHDLIANKRKSLQKLVNDLKIKLNSSLKYDPFNDQFNPIVNSETGSLGKNDVTGFTILNNDNNCRNTATTIITSSNNNNNNKNNNKNNVKERNVDIIVTDNDDVMSHCVTIYNQAATGSLTYTTTIANNNNNNNKNNKSNNNNNNNNNNKTPMANIITCYVSNGNIVTVTTAASKTTATTMSIATANNLANLGTYSKNIFDIAKRISISNNNNNNNDNNKHIPIVGQSRSVTNLPTISSSNFINESNINITTALTIASNTSTFTTSNASKTTTTTTTTFFSMNPNITAGYFNNSNTIPSISNSSSNISNFSNKRYLDRSNDRPDGGAKVPKLSDELEQSITKYIKLSTMPNVIVTTGTSDTCASNHSIDDTTDTLITDTSVSDTVTTNVGITSATSVSGTALSNCTYNINTVTTANANICIDTTISTAANSTAFTLSKSFGSSGSSSSNLNSNLNTTPSKSTRDLSKFGDEDDGGGNDDGEMVNKSETKIDDRCGDDMKAVYGREGGSGGGNVVSGDKDGNGGCHGDDPDVNDDDDDDVKGTTDNVNERCTSSNADVDRMEIDDDVDGNDNINNNYKGRDDGDDGSAAGNFGDINKNNGDDDDDDDDDDCSKNNLIEFKHQQSLDDDDDDDDNKISGSGDDNHGDGDDDDIRGGGDDDGGERKKVGDDKDDDDDRLTQLASQQQKQCKNELSRRFEDDDDDGDNDKVKNAQQISTRHQHHQPQQEFQQNVDKNIQQQDLLLQHQHSLQQQQQSKQHVDNTQQQFQHVERLMEHLEQHANTRQQQQQQPLETNPQQQQQQLNNNTNNNYDDNKNANIIINDENDGSDDINSDINDNINNNNNNNKDKIKLKEN